MKLSATWELHIFQQIFPARYFDLMFHAGNNIILHHQYVQVIIILCQAFASVNLYIEISFFLKCRSLLNHFLSEERFPARGRAAESWYPRYPDKSQFQNFRSQNCGWNEGPATLLALRARD